MKPIILSIILLTCVSQLRSQQWVFQEGGTETDEGTAIISDNNGHIYTTGFFSSIASFGNTTLSSMGSYDGYLTKYDTLGNFIWAKRFGGNGSDYPFVLDFDSNENIVIAGSFTNSNNIQIGSITVTTNNNSDNYFVAKFNSEGNVVWAKGNEGFVNFNDISIDNQDNVDLIATMASPSIFGMDTIVPYYYGILGSSFYSWDMILAQYSSEGNLNWAKKAGGHGIDYGNSITTDSNDNIYITGSIDSLAYFDTIQKNTINSAYDYYDAFVAKLNVSGEFLWVNNYGGDSSAVSGERIHYTNNELFLAGRFTEGVLLGEDTISGYYQSFVSKLDTLLNFSWSIKTGGRLIQGMEQDQNDNVFITGSFHNDAIFGNDTLSTTSSRSVFISKIDPSGSFIWSKQGGGDQDDVSHALCLDEIGNAYITGRFEDTAYFGGFTLMADPYFLHDIFIAKYASNESPTGSQELLFPTSNSLSVFPNPFSSSTTIRTSYNNRNPTLTVYNAFGQIIKQIKNISGQTITLHRDNIPRGLYFLTLTAENEILATSKLIVVD